MTETPHLLLVGAYSDYAARLLGMPVAVTMAQWPGQDAAFEETVALRIVNCDLADPGALLEQVRRIHAWRPVDAILSVTERALHSASVVAERLGIRANPVRAVTFAQDKAAMRRRLAASGIDTTRHRLCATPEEVREFGADCPDGVILKPAGGNGGAGVALVADPADPADLAAGWAWTAASPGVLATAWQFPTAVPANAAVLAEEYLTGQEVSVETLSVAGEHRVLAITAKHTQGPPHFFETGHDLPAPLTPDEQRRVAGAVVAALEAIGFGYGPCHVEAVVRPDRVAIVEFNARLGGAQIWEMISLATGVDAVAAAVESLAYAAFPAQILDIPPLGASPASTASGAAASVRLLLAPPGRVTAVTGADGARSVPGVLRVDGLPAVGDTVRPLVHGNDRVGYVLAAGSDVKAAARAAEEAAGRITVTTEPA